jgi:hypothetical protein
MRIETAVVDKLDDAWGTRRTIVFDGVDFHIIGGESGTTERLGRMAADSGASVILATLPGAGADLSQ